MADLFVDKDDPTRFVSLVELIESSKRSWIAPKIILLALVALGLWKLVDIIVWGLR